MTIDHISLSVARDRLQEHLALYLAALAPLGYEKRMQFGDSVGLGSARDAAADGYVKTDFWIVGVDAAPAAPVHLAFAAPDREAVDAFHAAAVKAGARDNGAPGPRPMYHANYYAAFVKDAAGNNVEAVFHGP